MLKVLLNLNQPTNHYHHYYMLSDITGKVVKFVLSRKQLNVPELNFFIHVILYYYGVGYCLYLSLCLSQARILLK